MKTYLIHGIFTCFCLLILALAVKSVLPPEEKSEHLKIVEEQETIKDIEYYSRLKRIFAAGIPGAITGIIFVITTGLIWAHLKRARVHIYKIGDSKFVVHERDLSLAHQVAMGLINAEHLKQYNAGIDKAFQLSMQIADIQSKHLRALSNSRIPMLPEMSDTHPDRDEQAPTPTFQELLNNGDIQPGKSMILGFEHGAARRGSFLDIYSAAVAGESGSGKTATLLFLIGSALVSIPVRFLGIDPHYPHPKSLGAKTEPLWEAGLMKMATDKQAMFDTLKYIDTTIDNRLKQIDRDTTPVVLVIDELAFLSTQSIGPTLARTMERISTEGRKCAVYMLASSQTWLVSRSGGSSVVRDTLTSAYVHRIKPKQANLLLQDKEEADKVKKCVKHPGEVLLCPVNDESVICKMPYTTEYDMKRVAGMVEPIFEPVNVPVNMTDVNQDINQRINLSELSNDDLINQVNARLKKGDLTRVSEIVGVSKPMISNVLNGKKKCTERIRTGLISYLEKIVPFPEKC